MEAGLINVAQLDEALARRTTTGERIGESLVALGYISERDLVRTLAKDADIPFLEAGELRVDSAVVTLVPAQIARTHNLVPLRADGRALVVAMGNPFDIGVIRSLERSSGRQIRTVTGDPALIMQGDAVAFDRIVSNLIINALRYGQPPIAVSASAQDRHFRLAVEDAGPGVSRELEPQLFERFTRGTNVARSGAGLGLSIARSYAHAHGGELLYTNTTPHGARFELVIPIS